MKVFFSNRLEILADKLRDRLFFAKLDPFAQKSVVVPTLLVKNFLLYRWAKDPLLGVATGVKVETLPSFLKMTSQTELSLLLEHELKRGVDGPLATYLQGGSIKRLYSLCDELASLFLRYLLFGEKPEGWQKELWDKAAPKMEYANEGSLFLFHLSYLSPPLQEIFAKVEGFFLSPSEMYWGDAVSMKEQAFLEKKIKGVGATFEGQNRLLGNLGKMGRQFLTLLEGDGEYREPEGASFLEALQKEILFLEEVDKTPDNSIQIHAATSKMREVEVLKETLLRLKAKSEDVLVLAPDIGEYAPYIHAVFGGSYDYAIFDLELSEESLLAKGLNHLLKLPSVDFSIDALLELFSFGNFLEKFRLSVEEAHQIRRWVKKVHIRYGLEGLGRLLEALITIPEERDLFLDFTDVPLLAKLVEIFQLLKTKLDLSQERTVAEWLSFFADLAETFFKIRAEDELLLKGFRAHPPTADLKFSFSSMERLLRSILSKKSGSFQAGALHAIRFASLSPGSSIPAEVICLLGMEEGLFPRKEKRTSLCPVKKGYQPSQVDEDRYLFLELLLSARKHFLLFYTKVDPEDGKEKEASSVLMELMSLGIPVQNHLPRPFIQKRKKTPLFSFQLQELGQKEWSVDVRMLKEFARHPLRYHLERVHGVEFEREENRFPEFVLSYLDLYSFRRQSLGASVEEIIEKAEKKGVLPEGSYREAAKEKIGQAVEEYQTHLGALGVKELHALDVDLNVLLEDGRRVHLHGRLEDVSEEGLLFHGEDRLDDLIKVWPLYMVYLQIKKGGKLLFSKSGKVKEPFVIDPLSSLRKYLVYFERSQPSPLIPAWAKSFLHGNSEGLEKAMQDSANGFFIDEVVRYMTFPSAKELHDGWSGLLKGVFSEFL